MTASVTVCGASRPGKVGRPVCRRPAREGDDDSLLKQSPGVPEGKLSDCQYVSTKERCNRGG